MLTRYPGEMEAASWDVSAADFAGNSAAFLYWDARELKPGEKRVLGFGYGLQAADVKEWQARVVPPR